jgi:hypothetical protein
VLLRESVAAENVPGGFSAVYDVLKALEESGRIRRGYFVAGLGATQFALPAAVDLLRQLRTRRREKPEFVQLAATDPANPYGSVLRWPDLLPSMEEDSETAPRLLTRAAYAEVILRNGQLVAWLRAAIQTCSSFCLPRSRSARRRLRGWRIFSARAARNACAAAIRACSSPPSTASRSRRIPWRASSWMRAFIPARWACTCAAFCCPSAAAHEPAGEVQ